MLFIHNIRSVAKYESKLLLRSWFFIIFSILILLFLVIYNLVMVAAGSVDWFLKSIPANYAYTNLLFLNLGQSIIAIFLASDFLKRDKKLDTSEVFYVRPLSNAEYVFGKIWGNLKVFLGLNLAAIGLIIVFNFIAGITIDWIAYLQYLLIISIPSLIFIIGLSVFLMLIIKNQAVTFVILLGYIGAVSFYLSDKYEFAFDYMMNSYPLVKSTVVGFVNVTKLCTQRLIYLSFGLSFIFFTISLFGRLPNSSRSHIPWLVVSTVLFFSASFFAFSYVYPTLNNKKMRKAWIELNNRYASCPRFNVDHYDITVRHLPDALEGTATLTGSPQSPSPTLVFSLNPGMDIGKVECGNFAFKQHREEHLLILDFEKPLQSEDTFAITIAYEGEIDEAFSYLDIDDEIRGARYSRDAYTIEKKYAFQSEEFVLLTPESAWYPQSGTTYSDINSGWLQSFFSYFDLKVIPLDGLTTLSQGECKREENGSYRFTSDIRYQNISLVIGPYEQKQVVAEDSVTYNLFYIKGHDFFSKAIGSLADTIPHLIVEQKEGFENSFQMKYPFRRFSLVETPIQFYTYPRSWTKAQEAVQPEMVFFPEKGALYSQTDFEASVKSIQSGQQGGGPGGGRRGRREDMTEDEAKVIAFNNFTRLFLSSENRPQMRFFGMDGGPGGARTSSANPYYLFPQLYNFRFNVYSNEWPIANRMVEQLILQRTGNSNWERESNGVSNNEKANMLLAGNSFQELLANPKHQDLIDNLVSLKSNELFAPAEIEMGYGFRDTIFSYLEEQEFRNILFEDLIGYIEGRSGIDIKGRFTTWTHPTSLPYYLIESPLVLQINDRGTEVFIIKVNIYNKTGNEGIISLNYQVGNWQTQMYDPRVSRKLIVKPESATQLVTLWDEVPRALNINTLISGNLPNEFSFSLRNNTIQENRPVTENDADIVIPLERKKYSEEIIVDNEDSLLFSVTKPELTGMLPRWLDKMNQPEFRYSGLNRWRPPLQWTLTINNAYYGEFIRSAMVIKNGKGDQTATWKIPIPKSGDYELFYHVYKGNDRRVGGGGRGRGEQEQNGEYHFIIRDGGEEAVDSYLNLRRADNGWERLGAYYFSQDTVYVTLTNQSALQTVIADAVKLVKRD